MGRLGPTGTKTAVGGTGWSHESLFRRNREDREISEVERATHDAELDKASNRIDQAAAGIGLNIVKDDAHSDASRF